MTSQERNPRQRSAPFPGRQSAGSSPAARLRGFQAKVRGASAKAPFPSPRACRTGKGTLDLRTSIMLCATMVPRFPKKSTVFPKNFDGLSRFCTNRMRAASAARMVSGWGYCAASVSSRSQERMTPFSSSKVVVLTMWVLPTRISWLPSSLVRLSFTDPSMVKTRS